MRVVLAPDAFSGMFSAVAAAEAMADGWRAGAPHDEVVTVPMSDGGPGFVDVVHAARGGRLLAVTVAGALGGELPAAVLVSGADAFVEAAQVVGRHLVPAGQRDVWRASSAGVGQLVAAAVEAGARRIHVGLGGLLVNDGGAGLLAALGATPADRLGAGPNGLVDLAHLDLGPALERLAGVEIEFASDVDNPLLGLRGTTNVYGQQRGAAAADLPALDSALSRLADLAGRGDADAKGAGAGGGIGYALLLLGARKVPGFRTVADVVGLESAIAGAGVVVTGEASYDWESMRGTVVSGVAAAGGEVGAACVVLAARVDVGRREMNANGVEAAYAIVNSPAGPDDVPRSPTRALTELAERTARTWSPPPRAG